MAAEFRGGLRLRRVRGSLTRRTIARLAWCLVSLVAWEGAVAQAAVGDANAAVASWLTAGELDGLRLAWVHDLGYEGRAVGPPAFHAGALYVSTELGVHALDAASGELRWAFEDPDGAGASSRRPGAPRGAPVVADGKVIVSLATRPAVVALDARDGHLVWIQEVGDAAAGESLSSNPTWAGDAVIVGPTGVDLAPTPGRLVALEVADGSHRWTFDLVPVTDDDPARASWTPLAPDPAYGIGGGTAWNLGAYDPVNEIVAFGTGQPVPTDRIDPRRYEAGEVSADLYTSSFVAVDVQDGELRWFHQVVPGDEWEYDQHTVPMFIDLDMEGKTRRVALLATTTGFVLVIDAETGDLLAHHEMVPFSTVHLGYDDSGHPIVDAATRRVSDDDVVRVCPGARWASVAPAAFDGNRGVLYRPNEWSCVQRGATQAPDVWTPGSRALWLQSDARSEEDFFDRWGAISAIDPRTGAILWEYTTPYRHDAGVVVTQEDLVISAFADRTVRILDAATGTTLWTYVLPSHADGTPLPYLHAQTAYLAVLAGRDVGVPALPASGLPPSVAGPARLFVFRDEATGAR